MSLPLDNRCPTCVIAGGQVTHAHRETADALLRACYAEEMAIVALRMLKRAGKLKPTTDDERAAVRLAGYMLDVPAADRRLLHPHTADYVETAADVGAQLLFPSAVRSTT